MSWPIRHLVRQGPVLGALLRTGACALGNKLFRPKETGLPAPVLTGTVAPRPADLVADYLRHVGGKPQWYAGGLPPHLFPQWGFPLLSRTLRGLPHDLTKVLNAGCRLEISAPLPMGEPLELEARLAEVDATLRRILLKQRLVTGTASAPRALTAEITAIIPLARRGRGLEGEKSKLQEKPRIPMGVREIDRWDLPGDAGLTFALLTGDFNPIHWIPPMAWVAGFSGPILHGFSCAARVIESLNRNLWGSDPTPLSVFEARFLKPIVLPTQVGLFIDDEGGFSVGSSPGAEALVIGSFSAKEAPVHERPTP